MLFEVTCLPVILERFSVVLQDISAELVRHTKVVTASRLLAVTSFPVEFRGLIEVSEFVARKARIVKARHKHWLVR